MQKRDGVVICIDCSKIGSADGNKLSEGYGVYCIYSKLSSVNCGECRTDGSTDTGGDLQDDRSVGRERERF